MSYAKSSLSDLATDVAFDHFVHFLGWWHRMAIVFVKDGIFGVRAGLENDLKHVGIEADTSCGFGFGTWRNVNNRS